MRAPDRPWGVLHSPRLLAANSWMRRASHRGGSAKSLLPYQSMPRLGAGGGQILAVRISPLGTVVQPRRSTSWRRPCALPRDPHTEQRSVPVELLRDAMFARSRAALPRRFPGVKRRLQAVRFRHFRTVQHLTTGDVLSRRAWRRPASALLLRRLRSPRRRGPAQPVKASVRRA